MTLDIKIKVKTAYILSVLFVKQTSLTRFDVGSSYFAQ